MISECNPFLCRTCYDYHSHIKKSCGHAVIQLTELKSEKYAHIQVQVKIPLCKEHNEQLKYYCVTYDKLVRVYCTVKKHNGHHHDSVKKMAAMYHNEYC